MVGPKGTFNSGGTYSLHAGRYVDVLRCLHLTGPGVLAPELDPKAVHLLDEEINDARKARSGTPGRREPVQLPMFAEVALG